jgi:glyoxylase-like metal-dependent hydrolase (beta-lactamase superfamily II)
VGSLEAQGVALVRADNPGPFTLEGTNTWLVGRDPAWLVDPGPPLEAHVRSVLAEARERGGVGGIALTHDHGDHAGALGAVREGLGGPPVAAARGDVDVLLAHGERFGPLEAAATPGHTVDHLTFLAGPVAFTGDAVLGEGSVFIDPDGGGLAPYLEGLRELRARELELLCPGHGPPVWQPAAKLDEYVAHRLDRERRLLEALADGLREEDELLDRAWADAPEPLRSAAAMTLRAHLRKLAEEDRLPADVAGPAEGGRPPL